MSFMDYVDMEREASRSTKWDAWIKAAKELCGHSLDGDIHVEGYSLDSAYEDFEKGVTPRQYVARIMQQSAQSMADDSDQT